MSNLDDIEKRLDDRKTKKEEDNNILLNFFLGIILLAVGIFMVFQCTDVSASWHTWYIGSWGMPSGTVVIPLLIGIGLLFYNSKSFVSWLVVVIGFAIILVTIIMSVHIRFRSTSLFNYILMFGSILAGTGLLLKSLFKKPRSEER